LSDSYSCGPRNFDRRVLHLEDGQATPWEPKECARLFDKAALNKIALTEKVMDSTFKAFLIAAVLPIAGLGFFLSAQDCQAGNSVTTVQTSRPQTKPVTLATGAPHPLPQPVSHRLPADARWKKMHHCHPQQFCTQTLFGPSFCSTLEVCQ
jgi:hypothetical protein